MKRFVWASYSMYFLGGVISVFFGAIMPEILAHYHTTYTTGGLLILFQSIGFIIGVPLTASCMKRFHYRFILSASALAVAAAQICILFLPRLLWVDVLVILNGIGASSLETAVASYIMEMFEGRRAIFMSHLEVSFGLGALCMPAIASGLIALHCWRLSSLVVGAFALALAIVWQTISVVLKPSVAAGQMDAQSAAPPVFQRRLTKYSILMMFLLMIFIYVGVEGSLNSFLPTIFTVYVKTRPYFASLSSSMFWIAMVCGRIAISRIVRRVSYERYLLGSISLAVVFFFLLTQLHGAWSAYATVFGLGLALSAIYSISMVYANHTFPGMERTVTSAVTAFAGVGGAVFPAVVGYAMDHFTPSQVLWLILAFALLLLCFFLLISGILKSIRHRSRLLQTSENAVDP